MASAIANIGPRRTNVVIAAPPGNRPIADDRIDGVTCSAARATSGNSICFYSMQQSKYLL
jgi:hypothetical protein